MSAFYIVTNSLLWTQFYFSPLLFFFISKDINNKIGSLAPAGNFSVLVIYYSSFCDIIIIYIEVPCIFV